jgi:transposase-like protein
MTFFEFEKKFPTETAAMSVGDTFKIFENLVEVDETYVGGKPRLGSSAPRKKGRGTRKTPVIGIVERGTKQVCARAVLNDIPLKVHLIPFILRTVVRGTTVVTDDFKGYLGLDDENYTHRSVNHSAKQYSDGNGTHTNNVENFWSILKRGIIGVYHKVSSGYLQRYVNEACFRRNNMQSDSIFDKVLEQAVIPQANRAWRVAA